MWMVIGLGNPGPRYEGTRHNAGFMVVDELARRHGGGFKSKLGAETGTISVGSERVTLTKPMEFMNRSGFAVSRTAQFVKTGPEQMVVVHDEADLDFGTVKVKSAGGHGGHNGLRSIFSELGSQEFTRVRVGVGKPDKASHGDEADERPGQDRSVADYLLSNFSKSEQASLGELISRAADAAEAVMAYGPREAMNRFNGGAKAR